MNIPSRFSGAEDTLHAAAGAAFGLHDFGPADEYTPGLSRLLAALDDGPRFQPGGRETVWSALVGVLISRAWVQKGWREQPQCLTAPIRRPLVITGVPRTGTTALHKLLAEDPQFQGLEKWLTVFPMPRPPRAQWVANPLYQSVTAGLEAFFASAPEMRAAHNIVADQVDECLEILKQDFCSNYFGSSWRVPAYDDWWARQDEAASYRRFAQTLQLIGAGEAGRPWLLKNPGHIHHLDQLLAVFPDACVVQTHRDPVKALPSLCSVLMMARSIIEGSGLRPEEIGRREMENWLRGTEASVRARERLPASQFLDVHQQDFHRDPMAVVRRIYGHFGFELDAEVEQRMRSRIAESPERQHGEHRYTLEQFGLDAGEIRERFRAYTERFGIQSFQ